MSQFFNHPKLQERRRSLRLHQTEFEMILWKRLRKKQLLGFRFLRQFSIGPYILDFYCPDKKMGIELDGGQHAQEDAKAYDANRDFFLRTYNIKMLRFWNSEIGQNIEGVLEKIVSELSNPSSPPLDHKGREKEVNPKS